ncbi:M23 family metallopeptidase [Limimaricola pyoseonensis]|uniref:Murein DD-endopeptidase MepM and murein hydrolase activator NlpD, contain LysM domain n=1 Tax=Limimaricola pyoseonensis TaxID=521013 RepID=A0A1G7H0F8_9RHOB|nr:M23 family metallopeptidase [Limimaricola pyoseonensis]SDE93793.1 Murein DD-endopeptidase MepM and murein hydrolase activator NlpD, contain LysM domain [Limimaricola pyoseonensis]
MRIKLAQKLHAALERRFPEKRLFLRSDTETRFIRLHPSTQLVAWAGATLTVGWTITATAIVLMDSIGAGNFRAQAQRDQMIYEERLNALSQERDLRASEAAAAQERFSAALETISNMQSELLASEERSREMETGLGVVQGALRRTMLERETAREAAERLELALAEGGSLPGGADAQAIENTLDILSGALADTAEERDSLAEDAELAFEQANELQLELRLMTERNDEIFRKLEEAMTVSVEPLGDMFRAAGMDPDSMLKQVRKGYSGIGGGALTPIQFSTMGGHAGHGAHDAERANALLDRMDEINLYRIAAEKAPFGNPVNASYRFTSGFGQRWGRLHAGADFAAPIGTPVVATADGVVTEAGWASGYGRLIKIQHEFGIETRYAHLNKIRVKVGQRVSRGDRIGDMGNSGRSTGPHLHYEVRVGGTPVNPMTYIRAGKDVF